MKITRTCLPLVASIGLLVTPLAGCEDDPIWPGWDVGFDTDIDVATDVDAGDDTDIELCLDEDNDGFYVDAVSPPSGTCGVLDCNDANPDINPFASEVCGNGLDEDCDGVAAECCDDNACGGCEPLADEPGTSCGVCGLGTWTCDGTEDVVCADELAGDRDSDGVCDADDPCPDDNPDDPDGDGECGESDDVELTFEFVPGGAFGAELGTDIGGTRTWMLGNLIQVDDAFGGDLAGASTLVLQNFEFMVDRREECPLTFQIYVWRDGAIVRPLFDDAIVAPAGDGWIGPDDIGTIVLRQGDGYVFAIGSNRLCNLFVDASFADVTGDAARLPFGSFVESGMFTDRDRASDFPRGPGGDISRVWPVSMSRWPLHMRFELLGTNE